MWCWYDMQVKYLACILTLFGALRSSNGQTCTGPCNNVSSSTSLTASLGSEVSLPCRLRQSRETDEAQWSQNSSLLSIRPDGNVTFEDPRDGRVTVFPYLFDKGNFSILIHRLQDSDLGMYCCQLSQECQSVEIKLTEEVKKSDSEENLLSDSKETNRDKDNAASSFWYYIVAGIAGSVLILIICILAFEFRGKCVKKITGSYHVDSPQNQTSKLPEKKERAGRASSAERQDSEGHYEDMEGHEQSEDYENMQGEECDEAEYVNTDRGHGDEHFIHPERADPVGSHSHTDHHRSSTVYENDDPNTVWKRPGPQNKDSRERPNASAPYYVNQSEMRNPDGADRKKKHRKRKKKAAPEFQIRNPIYDMTKVVETS